MFGIPQWAFGIGVIILVSAACKAVLRLLPPGRSLGDSKNEPPEIPEDLQTRLAELDALKRRLGELEERVDFAERLLAQQREGQRLAPPL